MKMPPADGVMASAARVAKRLQMLFGSGRVHHEWSEEHRCFEYRILTPRCGVVLVYIRDDRVSDSDATVQQIFGMLWAATDKDDAW